jgi:hypothetical protein
MGATMRTDNLKTVDFDPVRGKPTHHAIPELRSIASRHLDDHMQNFFAVVDDQLFKLSGMAKSNLQQSQYFEAMRYLRLEAGATRAQYQGAVLKGYDQFWEQAAGTPPKQDSPRADSRSEAELQLVENEAFEESLAISGMIEKGKGLHQRELGDLCARFAELAGRDALEPADHPLGPHVLCHALSDALRPMNLDLEVKLLVYKLYDQVVLMKSVGPLYQELNACLIQQDVLPSLTPAYKRPVSRMGGRPSARPDGTVQGWLADPLDESHQAYMEAFSAMEALMGNWRARMGVASLVPAHYVGPTFASTEVLNALNVLQHPQLLSGVPAQDGLKEFLQQQLRQASPAHDDRPFARREEDIIDMVSLLFEFILADANLPDPVKTLISRLQIPVIKVAIIEKSLLGRKNHPVRLLLNALAQAGIGLDGTEDLTNSAVFKRIEATVNRVLDEFDQNVDLFSELLDEFTAFMQKEEQRSGVLEERTRQVTQSKEHMQLAKHKVAYEIATRLQGKSTPAVVRSFLFNTWKDVLVLGYLRRDKSPGDWENSLLVMEKLIWSVTVPLDANARMSLVNAVPPLLKSIKVGLEVLSLDPQSVVTILKDLRACHVMRLSRLGAGLDAAGSGEAAAQHAEEGHAKVDIRDPELAKAIIEIRASLPDVENFGIAELVGTAAPDDQVAQPLDEALVAKVRNLSVGEWVELNEEGRRVRAKLSWKSQLTSTYVFVNRRGGKVAEIAQVDLARRLGDGTARVIEESGVPLMDRALRGLLNRLREPAKESEGPGAMLSPA